GDERNRARAVPSAPRFQVFRNLYTFAIGPGQQVQVWNLRSRRHADHLAVVRAINHAGGRFVAVEQPLHYKFTLAWHDVIGARFEIFFSVIGGLGAAHYDAPVVGLRAVDDGDY